jgi:hypothetical protein
MVWVTFGGLFWALEKRVRLVFRGFWRNGSLCRRAALVLVLFLGCRLPVSFLPLCVLVYMERCAVGPRLQGLLERPGEDFWLGGRRRKAVRWWG